MTPRRGNGFTRPRAPEAPEAEHDGDSTADADLKHDETGDAGTAEPVPAPSEIGALGQ
jgi:hypothetical protein